MFMYDKQGNQTFAFAPNGAVKRSDFNNLGRLIRTIDNVFDSDPALRRKTEYTYWIGRLIEMTAWRTATSFEKTSVEYRPTADWLNVVDDQFVPVSRNNGLIGRMRLPDPLTGNPIAITAADIILKYNFAGQVAETDR